MSETPTDIREHGVVDYTRVGSDDDYPPFRFRIDDTGVRQVDYPLASTKREIQTALAENRPGAMLELIFGSQWPDVSSALDDLGPRGDDAQTNLVLDYMDHIGMNDETIQRYRANRAERRAARKGRRAPR